MISPAPAETPTESVATICDMFHIGVRRSIATLITAAVLIAGCGSGEDAAEDAGIEDGLATTAPADSDAETPAGDESDSSGQTETDEESEAKAGGGGEAGDLDLEQAQQSAEEFSQCIRDQGVDVPDLEVDESGELDLANLIATVDPADPAVQQAILTCQGSLNGGLAASLNQILESQTFADALVSFSQCVRDGGYDVADLTFAAVVSATLGSGVDASAGEESVGPILATAMDLDPADPAVIETIDGCVVLIRDSLGDLGLGG